MQQQNAVMQALAQALAPYLQGGVARADGTPVTTYGYSEGGLFGTCKQDPVLINAMVGPYGYMGKMRWLGTDTENPITQSLTYIGSSGYGQTTACSACGTPTIKRCAQTTCFGRICQQTEEFAFDELGLRANSNVPRLALYGNITDPEGNVLIAQGTEIQNLFTMHIGAAGYNLRREIGQMIWGGNPVNNAGGYWEMEGFDLLINTGKVDALTNVACPALDSTLINFGGLNAGTEGDIVRAISALIGRIIERIEGAGFNSAEAGIDIVMHPSLWDCVVRAFACAADIDCQMWTAQAGWQTMINDALAVNERYAAMKNGLYLPVMGKNYPVTLDNGISYSSVGDEFQSDIYIITRELPGGPNGGTITFGEFQDFNATAGPALRDLRNWAGYRPINLTDGGRFAVAGQDSGGFCFDAKVLTKPRLRMLMPQLSGRVYDVNCNPTLDPIDPTGSGGSYEVDGGVTYTPPNDLYGDCFDENGDFKGEGWPQR